MRLPGDIEPRRQWHGARLAWKAERCVLAHGDLIRDDVETRLRDAWARVLRA